MIENMNGESILWPADQQYPGLVIPDDWDTIEQFVDWYVKAGKPILVPWDAMTIRTDDATAICVFRKGRYQVELYLIHPGYDIPLHQHPDMEVITMTIGGGGVCGEAVEPYGTAGNYGRSSKIVSGEAHGGKPTAHGTGFMLLSFEKWLVGAPTSAALRWKGGTAGPIHDALLEQYED